MDCDMLCLGDVAELANFMTLRTRWTQAVHVVKHDYTPKDELKFLGNTQTAYQKKNWSSVMLFNNPECHSLTPEFIHNAPGLALHQFTWIQDDKIGELPKEWNYLVGEENQSNKMPKLIHFTRGAPCFADYIGCEYAEQWKDELDDMVHPLIGAFAVQAKKGEPTTTAIRLMNA